MVGLNEHIEDEAAPEAEEPRTRARRGWAFPWGRARRAAGEHSALGEKLITGAPARIMRPRIIFFSCLGVLLAFGLLMVYSASSVEALSETGSATYYLERQAMFVAVGLLGIFVLGNIPLHIYRTNVTRVIWFAMMLLLGAVLIIGTNVGGATRWISLPLIGQLQPSEFAKPVIILTVAKIMHEYYEDQSMETHVFVTQMLVCLVIPGIALMLQPDTGTLIIIVAAVLAMGYFAGFSYKLIFGLFAIAGIAVVIFVASSPYRLARVITASDPWDDPYGSGYQATRAIMAFASGGLFGRGIGNSTMKYSYLPEAHNDYILAIIGEELGFVGTLIFFAVFALLIYSGFKIAAQSPSVQGRLIAYGCTFTILVQFLVNVLGILGVTPMTGKPLPFISYGGSSMISMLLMCGLMLRVSLESNPQTVYDARRAGLRVVRDAPDEPDPALSARGIEGSTAGVPHVRSARSGHAGFSVVDGTKATDAPRSAGVRTAQLVSDRMPQGGTDASRSERSGTYERVNLGSSAADRLRADGGRPTVRPRTDTGVPYGGRTRRSSRGSSSRGDSHDR